MTNTSTTMWLCRTCQTPCATTSPFCGDACRRSGDMEGDMEEHMKTYTALVSFDGKKETLTVEAHDITEAREILREWHPDARVFEIRG